MIKPLPYYVIPEIFLSNIIHEDPWSYIDTTDIMSDFVDFLDKIGILYDLDLDPVPGWEEADDLIDLNISVGNSYKNSWGSFYITWYKDTWECKHIWYSGNTDEDEQVYEDWENK